jgi:hypothetical protein
VAKIAGPFNNVRAWNGIRGFEVEEKFGKALIKAGIDVQVYTKQQAQTVKGFKDGGAAAWGSDWGDSAVDEDDIEEKVLKPEVKGYNVAKPLGFLQPDAELAIWAAHTFTPEEMNTMLNLQEGSTFRDYVRKLREDALAEQRKDHNAADRD